MKKVERLWAAVILLITSIILMWGFIQSVTNQGQHTMIVLLALAGNLMVMFMLAASLNEERLENRMEKIMRMETPAVLKAAETKPASETKPDDNFPNPAEDYKIVVHRERTKPVVKAEARPKRTAQPKITRMAELTKLHLPKPLVA